jgi:hypothetical protein
MPGVETKLKAGREVVVRYSGTAAGPSSLRLWVDDSGVLHVKALSNDLQGPALREALVRSAPFRFAAFRPVRPDLYVQATATDVWSRGAWAGMAYASWAGMPYAIAPVAETFRADRNAEALKDFRLRAGVPLRG